jgi:uncharacterized protein
MRFESAFSSPVPADAVFGAMMDVRSIASCLPGATIGDETDDGAMQATVAVRVGPIRMTYGGTVRVEDVDAEARTATMRVSAREQRGQGGAEATVALSVEQRDGAAHARMLTDLAVTGRVAQMGAGVMQEVANSMVTQFADCLSSRLAAAAPAQTAAAATQTPASPTAQPTELRALPLVVRAVAARIRTALGRG